MGWVFQEGELGSWGKRGQVFSPGFYEARRSIDRSAKELKVGILV